MSHRDIDRIIERVRTALPTTLWEQVRVSHPGADDDGLWFFSLPGLKEEIQVESSTGMCPFLVEGGKDGQRVKCQTADVAADTIAEWLILMR